MHRWDVLRLVALFTQKRLGLFRCLNIHVQAQRRRVFDTDAKTVHGLAGRFRFVMPDRGQGVADVALVNL